MTNWQLTKGLQTLRAQVNATFPDRSRTSDGTIGDPAHQAETSGHNPDDTPGARPEWNGDPDTLPEVRAWDCTSDFGPGVDAQDVVDHLRALPGLSTVLRYMIYNRRIYQASNGWRPQTYTGPSAHTEHIHFSGARTQAADNNTTFDYKLEEIPVALTLADKDWISDRIDAAVKAIAQYPVNVTPGAPTPNNQPWSRVDAYGSMERSRIKDGVDAIAKDVAALTTKVDALVKPSS